MRYIHIPTGNPVDSERELPPSVYRKVDDAKAAPKPKAAPKRAPRKTAKAAE